VPGDTSFRLKFTLIGKAEQRRQNDLSVAMLGSAEVKKRINTQPRLFPGAKCPLTPSNIHGDCMDNSFDLKNTNALF
jgi:hypothetical protein